MNPIAAILILLSASTAVADSWSFLRSEVGLGYSDNVYQDDLNKKSDWFTWLQLQAKYALSEGELTGKVGLNLYLKEDSNNSLNYSLKHNSSTVFSKTDLFLSLGGFSYFKSDIGSTDQSFNHFYFTAKLSKNWLSRSNMEFYLEPGIKLLSYPQLSGRRDLVVFGKTDMIWQLASGNSLNPYFEIGFVSSNKSYYDKTYVDLGTVFKYQVESEINAIIDIFLRNSSYPGRKVSDILIVPNRKGRSTAVSVDVNESISLFQISAYLTHALRGHEFSAGLNYSNQASISELEYYRELQLLAWWQTDI